MKITFFKLSKQHRSFLMTMGFSEFENMGGDKVISTLPTILRMTHSTPNHAYLCRGLHVRAELLSAEEDKGYLLIPLTAYDVIGVGEIWHVICRPKNNRTLIIQTFSSRQYAEEWLDRAYPMWRDPAEYWF